MSLTIAAEKLSALRQIVHVRCEETKAVPFAKLRVIEQEPATRLTVEDNEAEVRVETLELPSGGLQVVVFGRAKNQLLPGHIQVFEGFYKYPDETIAEMTDADYRDI